MIDAVLHGDADVGELWARTQVHANASGPIECQFVRGEREVFRVLHFSRATGERYQNVSAYDPVHVAAARLGGPFTIPEMGRAAEKHAVRKDSYCRTTKRTE